MSYLYLTKAMKRHGILKLRFICLMKKINLLIETGASLLMGSYMFANMIRKCIQKKNLRVWERMMTIPG